MVSIGSENAGLYPALRAAGLFHRRPTIGVEKDLVDRFASSNVGAPPRGQAVYSFIEPRLETGFPDLVIVFLDVEKANAWHDQRACFTRREICILHCLASMGGQSAESLKRWFSKGLNASLEKLTSANVVKFAHGCYRAMPVNSLLAVRRIVAIEAKIGSWCRGLQQAYLNRWFASESYLLLPTMPKSSQFKNELAASGVGLLTTDSPLTRPVTRAEKLKIPGSYASWFFNEWACRFHRISTS